MSERMALRARSMEALSRSWATEKRNMTDAASAYSPMRRAPTAATDMRKFMSRASRRAARSPLGKTYHPPVTTAAIARSAGTASGPIRHQPAASDASQKRPERVASTRRTGDVRCAGSGSGKGASTGRARMPSSETARSTSSGGMAPST